MEDPYDQAHNEPAGVDNPQPPEEQIMDTEFSMIRFLERGFVRSKPSGTSHNPVSASTEEAGEGTGVADEQDTF